MNLRRLTLPSLLLLSGSMLVLSACNEEPAADDSGAKETFEFDEPITWHEHIAPLVTGSCAGCHTEGGIAPFSVATYEEGRTWAAKMNREIQNGTMPPWGAQETDECTPPLSFKDDPRLTAYEKALFAQWIEDGRLEGDPADAPALPEPPSLTLADPDLNLTIPVATEVSGTEDSFVCYLLDPELTEEVWITASQVTPGNTKIVHHALVYLDTLGEAEENADEEGKYPCFGGPGLSSPTLVSAWAPGAVPSALPENTGTPVQPGTKLVMQVHYHPTGDGVEVDDETSVAIKWVTEEPEYVANVFLIGNFGAVGPEFAGGEGYGLTTGPDFLIPAGAEDHQEVNKFLIPGGEEPGARILPLSLFLVSTHMHYVGTDMKLTVTTPSGDDQCLLQTPAWDFNWQRGYYYDAPVDDLPALRAGDTLTMRCTYNNSLSNPFLREALDESGLTEPEDVVLGEETLDEMCLGIFGVAVPAAYKEVIQL